jgi:hypothetical protein
MSMPASTTPATVPLKYLKQGLLASDELQPEIEAFSDIALSGNAI